MSRYIDADALIRDLQERYCRPCKAAGLDYNEVRCRACQFDDEISDIDGFADNNIDIEPKRGEWEEKETFHNGDDEPIIEEWQSALCSVCHKYHTTPYMYYFNEYNFCPNCGADMRKREGE